MNQKEQEAHKAIRKYIWWSAGVSMIPWVCVDMYAVGGVQLKMVADLAKIYEVPFSKNLGKTAIGALGGFAVPHAIAFGKALSLLKTVPIVGTMVGSPAAAAFSCAYTWALGNLFIQHFESGGTFLTFNAEKVRTHFQALLAEAPQMVPAPAAGSRQNLPDEESSMNEKEQKARATVRKYMVLSMGSGLIPIPFVDLAVVSGVQLKMLAKLSHIYDVPFKDNLGKAAVGSWVGFAGPHSMTPGVVPLMLKSIPGLGYLAGGPTMVLLCGAYAWALGNTFIQHFESGGTFLNFDSDKVKAYFQAQFEEGKKVAAAMQAEKKAL